MTTLRADQLTAEDVERARTAIEHYYEGGFTDGLPVVPPIESFVQEFLAMTSRQPDEVVLRQAHIDRECTVRQAAINAVMAGCRPEYFPVVLAAIDCVQQIGGVTMMQSTTGQAVMFIVNGPIRRRLAINCEGNVFGSGHRANATIGRAVRLVVMNVMEIRPHDLDQSTQGTPAKYSCVIGENEEESPWAPLHVDLGFAPEVSTVTAQHIRSDLHVEHRSTQDPEHILHTLADSLSYAGGIYEAPPYNRNNGAVIVMGPEHAQIVAAGGWDKERVRRFLYDHFGKKVGDLRLYGKVIGLEDEPDDRFVHSGAAPDRLTIAVAGASNAGVSTVCTSFANRRATVAIESPGGKRL